MRYDRSTIQKVRHLQRVIMKPDVGKSCQGLAIKVNARASYDSIPAADHLWRMGEGTRTPSFFGRILTSSDAEIIWRPSSKKICSHSSLSNSNGISLP